MQDEQPAQDAAQPPKENDPQIATQFLHALPRDVANLVLAKLPLNDVKTVSLVSRIHNECTNYFIATAMVRFWGLERVKNTPPPNLKYHFSCAEYYAACSDARKAKALMRFFSMLILDLVKNYGSRVKECVTFNQKELPERLFLTCKNKHLLLDISDYLLEKFNFSLEFIDTNDTTHAVITRKQVERPTMLFHYVVYDFLKPADLIKISDRFIANVLLAEEIQLTDRHGWELFKPRVTACNGTVVQMRSSQNAATCGAYLLSKLHYLSDDIPGMRAGREGVVEMDLRHLENQPGFFTAAALTLMRPLIQRIMQENIPPDALEKALETEFAEYKKPALESKNDKCSVM